MPQNIMPKFRRRTEYRPRDGHDVPPEYGEKTVVIPREQPEVAVDRETVTAGPVEAFPVAPDEICGINGCVTCYDDPVVMVRHRFRVHGIAGPTNLNNQDATRSTKTIAEIQDDIVNQAVNRSR